VLLLLLFVCLLACRKVQVRTNQFVDDQSHQELADRIAEKTSFAAIAE